MVQLVLIFLFTTPPGWYSITTSERTSALFQNPAGLGIHPGTELYFQTRWEPDTMIDYRYALTLKNIGFSGYRSNKIRLNTFGSGIKVSSSLSLGYAYTFGYFKEHKFGFLFTPFRFLRLGATASLPEGDKSNYSIGLALRPKTDRITITGDVDFSDTIDGYTYTLTLEPVSGIKIFGGGMRNLIRKEKEDRYFAGISISLGHIRLTGAGSESIFQKDRFNSAQSITLSNEIYPTLLRPKRRWVKLEIEGTYSEERRVKGIFSFETEPSFYDLLNSLKKIEKSKDLKGAILVLRAPNFTPAQSEEFYNALLRMKKAGKHILVIGESFNIYNYAAVSAVDRIVIVPTGDIILPGIYSESIYLKNMFEKLGIQPQFDRIGKFKSAIEPLTRESMSEEDKFQITEYIKDLEKVIIKEIANGRGISEEEVKEWMDKGYFNSEDAVLFGLADTSAFEDDIPELWEKWFGEKPKPVEYKKLAEEKTIPREFKDERPTIAVLVGEGGIVTGESGDNPIPILGGKLMGSETMSELIKKIEKDKSIKAVVFRVNSPGGSALASEIIWNGIQKLKKKKPVVVSMGMVAGSGGYYVACPGTRIFTDRSTITGSIGILGGKLVLKNFFNNLGITFDRVKTRAHADAFSWTRPFDEEEKEILHKELEWGYWQFVERVANSRNLPAERVDSLGQGRIYSGEDAKSVRLVDEIGGLMDAIESAKELAGIKGDVKIEVFPTPKWFRFLQIDENVSLKSPLWSEDGLPYLYLMQILFPGYQF